MRPAQGIFSEPINESPGALIYLYSHGGYICTNNHEKWKHGRRKILDSVRVTKTSIKGSDSLELRLEESSRIFKWTMIELQREKLVGTKRETEVSKHGMFQEL